jgi:hypothetical protein
MSRFLCVDSGMAAITGAACDLAARNRERFMVLDIATSHTENGGRVPLADDMGRPPGRQHDDRRGGFDRGSPPKVQSRNANYPRDQSLNERLEAASTLFEEFDTYCMQPKESIRSAHRGPKKSAAESCGSK